MPLRQPALWISKTCPLLQVRAVAKYMRKGTAQALCWSWPVGVSLPELLAPQVRCIWRIPNYPSPCDMCLPPPLPLQAGFIAGGLVAFDVKLCIYGRHC